jgi:RluA family pseudouridine synthase
MNEPLVDSKFDIVYEDDFCVVVNKSGNIPVHEGGLYKKNCLTALLEKKLGYRVFPVYRLDRETSGLVVFAKNREAFKKIKISEKEYIAVCNGKIDKEIIIDKPIGEKKGDFIDWKKCIDKNGKPAKTRMIPVKNFKEYSAVRIIPYTGRQHQIRVHLSSVGHPILGDKVYGESDKNFKDYLYGKFEGKIKRQLLHLKKIKINDKIIEAEIPSDMKVFYGSE